MMYSKILEYKEDAERVYFSFFTSNATQNIIAIPKVNATNQEIYAGTSFEKLEIVEKEKAKYVLSEMMKRVLVHHPAIQLCNKDILKLIG